MVQIKKIFIELQISNSKLKMFVIFLSYVLVYYIRELCQTTKSSLTIGKKFFTSEARFMLDRYTQICNIFYSTFFLVHSTVHTCLISSTLVHSTVHTCLISRRISAGLYI